MNRGKDIEQNRLSEPGISTVFSLGFHLLCFITLFIFSFESTNKSSVYKSFQLIEISSPRVENAHAPKKQPVVFNENGIKISQKKNKVIKENKYESKINFEETKMVISETNLENEDSYLISKEGEEKNPYFDKIIFLVNKSKRYPRIAKINKESGIVKVSFTIEKDGRIVDVKVDCPCSYPLLNDAAVRAITEIGQFDPIPQSFNKEKIKVKIPIRFELAEN